jgi:hypothetical protein
MVVRSLVAAQHRDSAVKKMRVFGLGVMTGAALLLASAAANAETFDWTFTSNAGDLFASGMLTVDTSTAYTVSGLSGPAYSVTGGNGTISGPGILDALALFTNPSPPNSQLSPSGFFIYDDMLSPTSNPVISNPGLLFFGTSSGPCAPTACEYNFFSNGMSGGTPNGTEQGYLNNGFNEFGQFSITETPLPSAWTMLIAGFVGLGFFSYLGSAKKKTVAAAA